MDWGLWLVSVGEPCKWRWSGSFAARSLYRGGQGGYLMFLARDSGCESDAEILSRPRRSCLIWMMKAPLHYDASCLSSPVFIIVPGRVDKFLASLSYGAKQNGGECSVKWTHRCPQYLVIYYVAWPLQSRSLLLCSQMQRRLVNYAACGKLNVVFITRL